MSTSSAPDTAQPFGNAMVALIAPRWERVWNEIDRVIATDDPDAIHDVRVASRRLRAAMDVAAPGEPASWFAPLHRAAKEITSALGDVRDLDVLLIALRAERDKATGDERGALDVVIDDLAARRAAARDRMVTFLQDLDRGGIRDETRRRFPMPDADEGDDV